MHKVVTINLNGRAYQLDENAFDALHAYLDRAEAKLRENPDRAEILADLEQAIADKCQRYLSPHKTVVTATEIAQVLDEMGPVEGPGAASAGTSPEDDKTTNTNDSTSGERPRADTGSPRRLYRVMDGAMIGGVCNGIAAFFGIDVTLVRIALAAIAILELAASHSGVIVILYLVLMVLVPGATTSEEQAAARGVPFNAQEVIDRAKRNIAAFKDDDWRHQKREWRRQHREWRRQLRHTIAAERWTGTWGPWTGPTPGYGTRMAAGVMMPILAVASLVLLASFLYGLFSLLSSRAIYVWPLPDTVPLWVAILALVLVYNAVAWPLHFARRVSYHALGGSHVGWYAAGDGLLSIGVAVLLVWLGYHYVPEVHDFIDRLPTIWANVRDAVVHSR
jgi:phage shock protein PspC (stress-responsive transcriptional regulator)